MSINDAVAERLEETARMLELLGEDAFRVNAYRKAARAVEDMDESVAELAEDRTRLLDVPGIGPKLADRIIELVRTGSMPEREELRARVPAGLLDLLRVPGLGPKTVRAMWTELSITDAAGLRRAIEDGSLRALPRMGEKAIGKIEASLAFAGEAVARLPLGRAHAVAETFLTRLRGHPAVARAEVAGSLRRGRDTVGNIDLLAAVKPGREGEAGAVLEAFAATPTVVERLDAGGESASAAAVRVTLAHDLGRWKPGPDGKGRPGPSVRVDLRVVPLAGWGAAMVWYTGSEGHRTALGRRAASRGVSFGAGGVGGAGAASEGEVFAALGLPDLPPEVREGGRECELSAGGCPRLLEISDIRAELHAHTVASDGALEIEELARHALARGFHTIAVTDHSRSSAIAGGLQVDRLLAHVENVRRAAERVPGITILAGSEVDILADGSLDYDDDVLARLDVVVASPHTALSQDPAAATARMLRAIENPHVRIMGHLTGRLINRRKGLEPDLPTLFAAAAERGVALEINAHWMRLDLRDEHVRMAMDAGCLIAVDCDVHRAEDFDNLRFGVQTARRGWVTPERCVNAWDAARLRAWLEAKS